LEKAKIKMGPGFRRDDGNDDRRRARGDRMRGRDASRPARCGRIDALMLQVDVR
jgi:hypothetical protein